MNIKKLRIYLKKKKKGLQLLLFNAALFMYEQKMNIKMNIKEYEDIKKGGLQLLIFNAAFYFFSLSKIEQK